MFTPKASSIQKRVKGTQERVTEDGFPKTHLECFYHKSRFTKYFRVTPKPFER